MEMQHWVMLTIVALVFYVIGAKYPATAQRLGF
jgi:hypothetical protein